jgi:hypothetical protein
MDLRVIIEEDDMEDGMLTGTVAGLRIVFSDCSSI